MHLESPMVSYKADHHSPMCQVSMSNLTSDHSEQEVVPDPVDNDRDEQQSSMKTKSALLQTIYSRTL